jgi:hypothetical protein
MLHRNLYLENKNLWEEVKKQAFIEKKTCSGFIEEILTHAVSERKEKALTPEFVGFYIQKNFVKGTIINDLTISKGACGEVWISKRKFKTILDDLILNGVIREVRVDGKKKGYKGRDFEVL